MKTIISIITLILVLTGCRSVNVESKTTQYIIDKDTSPLELLTIDSCQYLYGAWGHSTVLTHKGNCNNRIHKQITN